MKNVIKRVEKLEKLKGNWKTLKHLGECDQTTDIIDLQNKYVGKVEKGLTFRTREEHKKWLDVLSSYKFWEDFEDLTNSIIKREEKELEELSNSFYDVAHELAKTLNFKALFNAFSVASGWTSKIEDFAEWWESEYLTKEEKQEYINDFKEIYEKDFDIEEIKKAYYGFEKCSIAMFYEDNENGKSDLMETIFSRYLEGSYRDIDFLINFINEMLNPDLFGLLRTYRKTIKDFENDTKHNYSTKGSLDRLQDVQADIYEWVEKNI